MATNFDTVNKSSTMALSGGNLTVTSSGVGTAAAQRKMTGLTYYEVTVGTLTGTPGIGFVNSYYNMASGTVMGTDNNGLSYRSSGAVVLNGATLSTIATYVAGNRVDVAVDMINQMVWFRVAGGNWNNSGAANPATNTGGISYAGISAKNIVPAVTASATGTIITAAFDTFAGTPPSGFVTVTTQQGSSVNGTADRTGASLPPPSATILTSWGTPDDAWYGGVSLWSPSAAVTSVSGQVQEAGTPVAGKNVFLYDHDTGQLLGHTVSDGSGNFSIPALGRVRTFAVATDSPTYNALIFDMVVPV